ncbi:MAG: OmpA family protein, partial [Calditrichota bacterium]
RRIGSSCGIQLLDTESLESSGVLVIDSLTNAGQFNWKIDSLKPGQNRTFDFKAKVALSSIKNIRSSARLNSENCDLNPADNCIPHELPILRYDIKLTREVEIEPLTPNVNFKTAKYELTPVHKKELEIYGRAHRELETILGQKVFIKLGGHTDQVGRASSNQILSENRVNSVAGYFVNEFGVPQPEGIFAYGYGENALLERKPGESNRAKNARDRRAELYFLKTKDTSTEKGGKIFPNDSNLIQITEEDPIEYTITIRNNGPDIAKLIKVKVAPQDDAVFVQNGITNSSRAEQQGSSSEWHIKNLGVGDDHKIEIRYRLTTRDKPGKVVYKISHTTTITTDTTDESGDEETSDTLFVMKKSSR